VLLDVSLFLPGAIIGGGARLVHRAARELGAGQILRWFQPLFERTTGAYGKTVAWTASLPRHCAGPLRRSDRIDGVRVHSFAERIHPIQDKGYIVTNIQLPDSSSLERSVEVTHEVQRITSQIPGVGHVLGIPGQSFVTNAISPNNASAFMILDPFAKRHDSARSGEAIRRRSERLTHEIPDAKLLAFGPPAVRGLEWRAASSFMVEATGDADFRQAPDAATTSLPREINSQA